METREYSPARGVFSPWPKTPFRGAIETLGFALVFGIRSSMAENFSLCPRVFRASIAQVVHARKQIEQGRRQEDVAALLNVNRSTLYRALDPVEAADREHLKVHSQAGAVGAHRRKARFHPASCAVACLA